MGIDAEMLIRKVPHSVVTDEWLKAVSWHLCTSIGAQYFFIDADKNYMAVERSGSRYREDHDLPAGYIYHQDGDPIMADPGECLLRVNLSGRYYGIGYERGNLLIYCAVAEWFEENVPGCEVWYGGDSSGVCAYPFTEEVRTELKRHLYSSQGKAYYAHFGNENGIIPKPCSLCPGGKYMGNRYGYGKDFAAFSCTGCGKNTSTRDNGKTWIEED